MVQFLAQNRVGVYLIGAQWGETKENIWPLVERYVGAFQKALADELPSYGEGQQHQCVTEFEIDSRDRNNWDRMADWLDERRRVYE